MEPTKRHRAPQNPSSVNKNALRNVTQCTLFDTMRVTCAAIRAERAPGAAESVDVFVWCGVFGVVVAPNRRRRASRLEPKHSDRQPPTRKTLA